MEPDRRFPRAVRPVPPLPLAGWWRRCGALAVDVALGFVAIAVVAAAAGSGGGAGHAALIVGDIVGVWVVALVLPMAIAGRTIGKLVFGVRVVAEDGRPVGLGAVILRELVGRLLVELPLCAAALAGLFSYVWPLVDDQRQSWHDKIGHTLVVRTRLGAS